MTMTDDTTGGAVEAEPTWAPDPAAAWAPPAPAPLVYLAGPITADPLAAPRQALEVFAPLRALGLVPFLPQLTVLAEMIQPRGYEEWMGYDFDVIARCQALVRLPGESPGADREVEWAETLGLPVFWWPGQRVRLERWATEARAG